MKQTFIICLLVMSGSSAVAQTFQYHQGTLAPNREVEARQVNDTSSVSQHTDATGFWQGGVAVLPSSQLPAEGSALTGVVQISDLSAESICVSQFSWNMFSTPVDTVGWAEGTFTVPFTLAGQTRLRLSYSGYQHALVNGSQINTGGFVFLTDQLNGGSTLLMAEGSELVYLDLPAGDYRLSAPINSNTNCGFGSCDPVITSAAVLNLEPVQAGATTGDELMPYLPDSIDRQLVPDESTVNDAGAFTQYASQWVHEFSASNDGWYEIGLVSDSLLTTQNNALFVTLTLPAQLSGALKVEVDGVELGGFTAGQHVVFADFAALLGPLLISGHSGQQGVEQVRLLRTPADFDLPESGCGAQVFALGIDFDQPGPVSWQSVNQRLADAIFFQGFDD